MNTTRRRIATTVLAAAALALTLVPGHAGVTPVNITCVLSGSAHFSPGVKLTAQPLHYTFAGNLANCKTQGVSLKSAHVSASGSGRLSCATGSSAGSASIVWNNGKTSGASFTTSDVGALVRLTGKITSGYLSGIGFKGLLAFEANPVSCVAGLTAANFTGAVTTL